MHNEQITLLVNLELLHFHIGSQIPSIQSIKAAIKEGARVYTELYAMGAQLKYIDVGGGLGIDYDGSGKSDSSTNYSEQEYANDIVATLQSICDEKHVPHPNIVSESGRALVAHSSLLVFDVLGTNEVQIQVPQPPLEKDSRLVYDFIVKCKNVLNQGKQLNIKWYHYGGDEDGIDYANLVSKLINYPIENIEID